MIFDPNKVEPVITIESKLKRKPQYKDAPNELLKNISHFFTGSCVVGGSTKKSDIDICILKLQEKDVIIGEELRVGNSYGGYRFMWGKVCINIIPLEIQDYYEWYVITNYFKENRLLADSTKSGRYMAFSEMRKFIGRHDGLTPDKTFNKGHLWK